MTTEETYQRLLANPGLFANELRALTSSRWVIVDEVQQECGAESLSTPHGPVLRTQDGIEVLPF